MRKRIGKKQVKQQRPLAVKLLIGLYAIYSMFPLLFFVAYLSDTIAPIVFGTLSMAFSFMLVSFLFVLYFGVWKMRKWGLYFTMFMAFIIIIDWSTRFMLNTTGKLDLLLTIFYHATSILLILGTFYVFYVHRDEFK